MLDRYLRAAPPPSRVTWFMIWRMYKDGGAKACFDTYFFFRPWQRISNPEGQEEESDENWGLSKTGGCSSLR